MSVARYIIRLLTFRLSHEQLLQLNSKHLIVGLLGTWLVGMGRYWDDPGAHILQHLGLGSVIYIFGMSLFIWIVIKPYFVDNWSYITVLTFVSLTSFPAAFYAIPVERFFAMKIAAEINVWFLAIVAAWRLALLFYFLIRFTRLGFGYILVGTLLPVCIIIVALSMLNLERAVFDIMGGIRDSTSNDRAYGVLILLTAVSMMAALPLLVGYIIAIYNRWNAEKAKRQLQPNREQSDDDKPH